MTNLSDAGMKVWQGVRDATFHSAKPIAFSLFLR
jgi:hypothetical protein